MIGGVPDCQNHIMRSGRFETTRNQLELVKNVEID